MPQSICFQCTHSLTPDVFRGDRKGGLGANGLKIAYRLPWSLIIPLSWNREGAILTIAGDCKFIKPSLIWQLYIWRWPLHILKEAEINNDEWQAHSNKSPNPSKNNQTNKASKFPEQHHNKNGIQKYLVNLHAMKKQNNTQKKEKRIHKCYCCVPNELVPTTKQNLYAVFMLIFYVCVFSWTWGMLHMCGSHPSPCFDKLDLPLSTENEDSALSQRAILTAQVWWRGSQTSWIPLARWFALSRWCHQDY